VKGGLAKTGGVLGADAATSTAGSCTRAAARDLLGWLASLSSIRGRSRGVGRLRSLGSPWLLSSGLNNSGNDGVGYNSGGKLGGLRLKWFWPAREQGLQLRLIQR
jgi:hypothetical protein